MIRIMMASLLCLFSATLAAKSIVVLGDSISAGYGMDARQGWVALLQQRLGDGYSVANESISGDTTAGGLARIDQTLARHRPDILILELGANDGLRGLSPSVMQANLAEIIRRARAAGSRVLLLSMRIPPNYGKRYTEMFYNVYPNLAKEMGVTYVPFILQDVALVEELMQRDGLHPNAKAQAMIADQVWLHLEPLL